MKGNQSFVDSVSHLVSIIETASLFKLISENNVFNISVLSIFCQRMLFSVLIVSLTHCPLNLVPRASYALFSTLGFILGTELIVFCVLYHNYIG